MAHYRDGGNMGFVSTGDLSAAGNQFLAVKLDSNGQIVLASAATDKIIGTLLDTPGTGRVGTVRLRSCSGTLNILVGSGGSIARGDAVTADSAGAGVTTTTAGNQIIGYALEAGAAGTVIELMPSTAKV